MSTPRSITSALALAALTLAALAVCVVPPDPPQWKKCADGTVCPIDTACSGADLCLRCEAVRDLASWAHCDDDTRCPTEAACAGDRAECLRDSCHGTVCGDGFKAEAGEECDDGNLRDGDGCDSNCRVTDCGNGIRTSGEECDDGNRAEGDGCDQECRREWHPARAGPAAPGLAADGPAADGDAPDGDAPARGR